MIISAHQPMSVLTQVLFEPSPSLQDSVTYDITAWALPYARGLKAYAAKSRIKPNASYDFANPKMPQVIEEKPYSYIFKWNSLEDAAFLSTLLQNKVKVRYAQKSFTTSSSTFPPGSLVITRADNKHLKTAFDEVIQATAYQHNRTLNTTTTGFMNAGVDFGSGNIDLITKPEILAVYGDGVNSNSYGQVWHYFENTIQYPFTAITKAQLSSIDLSDYNTLVLTDGSYSINDKVIDWIRAGGKLVAIGRANGSLSNSTFKLKRKDTPKNSTGTDLKSKVKKYGDQVGSYISNSTPGAIFGLTIDETHPLAYGISDSYFSIKTSTTAYEVSEDLWNVGYIDEAPMSMGFVGEKAKQKINGSVVLATQSLGRGQVVYFVDNPLYRSFWDSGKFLMSNALFMVE